MKKYKIKKAILILCTMLGSLFISASVFIGVSYHKFKLDKLKLTSFNNGVIVVASNDNQIEKHNSTRSITSLNELPEYVKNAFIAIEDKNFYSHNGYDFKRIIKSLLVNITSNSKSQGASTISQQLIKNALLTNEKTYSRKFKELILAIKLEKNFSKDEILEMYLNTIYFGSNAYGLENASKTYFDKSASEITLNEACCLAGLIKAPNIYSPLINYEKSVSRKNLVAQLMYNLKMISYDELQTVLSQEIILNENTTNINCYEKEAILEACSLLGVSERELINKQYKLQTFKQNALQNEIIKSHQQVLAEQKNDLDSLSIVAKNNGAVLAYYANSIYDLHDLRRQPASTLKPLAVYLPCFTHNILTPSSLILDEKIDYNGFSPNNADGKFHGNVSVRDALSQSLNIPAVKALDYVGVVKAKNVLNNLGILISNSDLNLSLALGSTKNGVKLTDLVSAYITLANQGYYSKLCFVDKIFDKENNVVYSHEDYYSLVAEPESCFMLNDILKDSSKTGTAKRLASLNLPIASKTGTAGNKNGNTDIYNIAYSTEHTLLTWISNIKNIYLPDSLLSSCQPTEINKNLLSYLYSSTHPSDFQPPKNIVRAAYDINELNENNKLIHPNHSIERYIAYDYFKETNKPLTEIEKECMNLSVQLSREGANISFTSTINKSFKLMRNIKNKDYVLSAFNSKNGTINYLDSDIFNHEEVCYYLIDDQGVVISNRTITKPQEYLINSLNNEFLSTSKKKWFI